MFNKKSLITIFINIVFFIIGSIATFLILNPFIPQIRAFFYRISPINITQNSVAYFFVELNKDQLQRELLKQNTDTTSLEHVTEDQIEKYTMRHGDLYTVEDKDTELIIKSVDIKGRVVDGKDASTLDRGFWFYPLSAPFGKKGRSIIIAHRFQYIPPRTDTFFNLDKIHIGDKVLIKQKNITFVYQVINKKIVDKNDLSVLSQTDKKNTLELITCTPLWTAKQRLVITAQFEYKTKEI
jgi:sortase A